MSLQLALAAETQRTEVLILKLRLTINCRIVEQNCVTVGQSFNYHSSCLYTGRIKRGRTADFAFKYVNEETGT